MKFEFSQSKYTSRDSRAQVLAAVTELIPDDYYKVIDFYDRFRKMTAFKQGLSSSEPFSPSRGESGIDPESVGPDGKSPAADTRDKLIRELETRLASALKQIELTDSYNNELVTLYQKQTDELIEVTRKLNQLTANQATETARRLLEDNAQVFTLKKQLADAQSCIVRSRIQGDDLARLETELAEIQNEVTKYKELNRGLTDQLLTAKRDLKLKAEESANSVLAKNRSDIQINTLQAETAKLQAEITTLTARIKDLDGRLLTVSSARPDKDALEQVLTSRCEELAKENKTHVDRLAQVQRELAQVQKDYDAFRGQLTRMMISAK
jgi:chromosome segregation ATPase